MTETARTAWPLLAALLIMLPAGCAAAMQAPAEPPDPAHAERVAQASAPAQPFQVIFDWSLRERDARFSGRGSARIAPDYRARLDLFGPRGETYVAAALVGTDLAITAAQDASGELPPPELLWTVLGTFHPPAGAELVRTDVDGSSLLLEYTLGRERWRFRFTDDRLVHAEWDAGRAGRRTVELRGRETLGLPAVAVYRDITEFRELTLTLNEVHEVDSFPPHIFAVPR
jgi:hypothetical protein